MGWWSVSILREHDEHPAAPLSVVYLSSPLGTLQIEECDACGYLRVQCEHENNTWHDGQMRPLPFSRVMSGKHLICDLCGSEGT